MFYVLTHVWNIFSDQFRFCRRGWFHRSLITERRIFSAFKKKMHFSLPIEISRAALPLHVSFVQEILYGKYFCSKDLGVIQWRVLSLLECSDTICTVSLQVFEILYCFSAGSSFALTMKEWHKFELLKCGPTICDASLKNEHLEEKSPLKFEVPQRPLTCQETANKALGIYFLRKVNSVRELNQ